MFRSYTTIFREYLKCFLKVVKVFIICCGGMSAIEKYNHVAIIWVYIYSFIMISWCDAKKIIKITLSIFCQHLHVSGVSRPIIRRYNRIYCAKPGYMDWVRDFDFMLNLFSLPSPPDYYLFLRQIPYQSLWSHPRNRPLVNTRERQSLAAATIPQRFGHCTCSELKYVKFTKYVRVQAWTRACEQSVYVVCVPGWFIK